MAAFGGSLKHMPAKTITGDYGYTSRRRREALEGMGYQLDSNGFIIDPNAQAGGAKAGGTPATSTSISQLFAGLAPAMLGNASAFARPEAAAWLAQATGQQMPAAAPAGPKTAGGGVFDMRSALSQPIKTMPMPVPGMVANPQQNVFAELLSKMFGNQGAKPGPKPSPFLALRGLQGAFGNGAAGMAPGAHQNRLF